MKKFIGYNVDLVSINPLQNNRFILLNAVANCATILKDNQPSGSNPALYKSCFCCDEEYNPDSSLECPANPWN